MKLIESLERLERVAVKSRTSDNELTAAVRALADKVEDVIPAASPAGAQLRSGARGPETWLPRGYYVAVIESNIGSWKALHTPAGHCLNSRYDGGEHYLHDDFYATYSAATRAEKLEFSKHVKAGWLEEVAQWMEERAAEAAEAKAHLLEESTAESLSVIREGVK